MANSNPSPVVRCEVFCVYLLLNQIWISLTTWNHMRLLGDDVLYNVQRIFFWNELADLREMWSLVSLTFCVRPLVFTSLCILPQCFLIVLCWIICAHPMFMSCGQPVFFLRVPALQWVQLNSSFVPPYLFGSNLSPKTWHKKWYLD